MPRFLRHLARFERIPLHSRLILKHNMGHYTRDIWAIGYGAALLAVSGCAVPDSAGRDPAAGPARVTIELAGTTATPGSLWLGIESLVLIRREHGNRNPEHGPPGQPRSNAAFVLALNRERVLLDEDGALLAEEVRVAPGSYRELRLHLREGSLFTNAGKELAIAGGGAVPIDLELAAGDHVTLAIHLDGDRSLTRTPDGKVEFQPVLASASVRAGAARAHGKIRGRVVPADPGAMIVVYDGATQSATDSRAITFADPRSGDFTLEELPVGDYRVEVNPLQPSVFESRILASVHVPWDGLRDLGAIELAGAADPAAGVDSTSSSE